MKHIQGPNTMPDAVQQLALSLRAKLFINVQTQSIQSSLLPEDDLS